MNILNADRKESVGSVVLKIQEKDLVDGARLLRSWKKWLYKTEMDNL